MRWVFILAILAVGATAFGQISADEAMAKLKAKQDARSKQVTISQGELDDLRAEVASLKSQLAAFKAGGVAGAAAPAKSEPIRAIAVGATRDQVMDFLRRHPNEYEVLANAVSTAHTVNRTTVTSVQRQGSNSVNQQAGSNVSANQNEDTTSKQKTIEEGDKSESITLLRKTYQAVEVGKHMEYNGVNRTQVTDSQKQWVAVEKLFVHMVENQVSSIDREPVDTPHRIR